MSELKIEYYAGLFDGEGYIQVARQSKGSMNMGKRVTLALRTGISMCDPAPLVHLASDFGGRIYTQERPNPKHRTLYAWLVTSKSAHRFLLAIQPFCIVKKPQIDLAIQFAELVEKNSKKFHKVSDEEYAVRLQIKNRLHELKRISVYGAFGDIGANSGNGENPNPELTRRKSLKCVETIYPGQSEFSERQEIVHSSRNSERLG